jgi:hypothetical protein
VLRCISVLYPFYIRCIPVVYPLYTCCISQVLPLCFHGDFGSTTVFLPSIGRAWTTLVWPLFKRNRIPLRIFSWTEGTRLGGIECEETAWSVDSAEGDVACQLPGWK